MTATNHALTGALIAVIVKQPALAIPLAFASHFAADLIPHYNPKGMTRQTFNNYADNWSKKLKPEHKSFRIVFAIDAILLIVVLASAFFISHSNVSAWTIFFSSLAAISPDFVGAAEYLGSLVAGFKPKKNGFWAAFTRFHVRLQWMESPSGIYLEMVWFVLIGGLILKIGR